MGKADVSALFSDAKEGDIFVTQLENPFPIVLYALKTAKEKGLFTVFNPAPAYVGAEEAVAYSDLILPNQKELKLLTGKDDVLEGCNILLQCGAKAVIVTLGEKGSFLCTKDGDQAIPPVNVGEAVDTTGAGDTFCGGLCVKLAEGENLEASALFASLCSGIAVTRRGSQIAVPKREEVEKTVK